MPGSLTIDDDVRYVKGVGPSVAEKLGRLGIERVGDLFYYFPRDYEDRRSIAALKEAKNGQRATFRVRVTGQSTFYYRGRHHPKISVQDKSGSADLYCFNRQFLTNILKPGVTFYLTGVPSRKYGAPTFAQFDYELDTGTHEPAILPVYRLTAGLSQKTLRKLTAFALKHFGSAVEDDIPAEVKRGYRFKDKREYIEEIHFPSDMTELRRAREVISYQEFFKYQLVVALVKSRTAHIEKERPKREGRLKEEFLRSLPFGLTMAQKRVVEEIEADMQRPSPMNRLIQGDVGCGKTVVSLIAALISVESGGQVALMAPTELLARQHFGTVLSLLSGVGIETAFLSGSVRKAKRSEILQGLKSGRTDILIGTHALFSEDVVFKNLSLAIIDEQHKFGVIQRGTLREKGNHPDCIVMSATPIPRTLSMTLYGDLDVSVIDEMPPGRGTVRTEIVRQAQSHRVYDTVAQEIEAGRQAYFIYPLIEESSAADLKNAVESYEYLQTEIFPQYRIGLLHGRLSDEEKTAVMTAFKDGEHDIIVSTTVIEVGIDVPNATVMVIEQAERFGLSNIHQLRGRIGRGGHTSYCFLIPDRSTGMESFARLRILKDTQDGFKIAEYDLKLRGPGELVGRRQHGIPEFIIDNFEVNTRLIYRAQKDAKRIVEERNVPEIGEYIKKFVSSETYRSASLYYGG